MANSIGRCMPQAEVMSISFNAADLSRETREAERVEIPRKWAELVLRPDASVVPAHGRFSIAWPAYYRHVFPRWIGPEKADTWATRGGARKALWRLRQKRPRDFANAEVSPVGDRFAITASVFAPTVNNAAHIDSNIVGSRTWATLRAAERALKRWRADAERLLAMAKLRAEAG